MAEVTAVHRPARASGVDHAAQSADVPSEPHCPGCGKGIDPLRAGHVAVFDGVFLYYCDASCKAAHLRVIAAHLGDDVPTMDPPAVAERVQKINGANGNGTSGHHAAAPAPFVFHEPSSPAPSLAKRDGEGSDSSSREGGESAPSPVEEEDIPEKSPSLAVEPTPVTQASPQLVTAPMAMPAPPAVALSPPSTTPPVSAIPSSHPLPTRTAPPALSLFGVVAGLLVPLLALADVATGVRVALCVVAAMVLVGRLALARRGAAQVHPLIAAVPVAAAAVVAVTSELAADPRAAAIAVLVGLSSAVALGVEEAIDRVWSDIDLARKRTRAMLDVASHVVRGAGLVDARDVKAGEEVVVEAGDVVGVDGVVRAGEVEVIPWDDAPPTVAQVTKREGDAIVAGARVVSGRARLVASWAGGDRAWARATSRGRPDVSAHFARLARLFATRAIPAAAVVAAGAACASGVASGWPFGIAAACSVFLGLGGRAVVAAVALVHARAHAKALVHGVVYRDARAFDAAGRAAIAVVCSRGTVLTGEPEIVAVEPAPGVSASEARILALAAGAETASSHPFATAILRAARTRSVAIENVRSAAVHAGLGVTALAANGERLVVGSRALLLSEKVSVAVVETRASELEAQGRSVLLVALAGKLVGLVALQDGLRAGARAAVQRLLDARIEPVLLSGESRETCETIARALDIDHVRPEVLPADRAPEVRALAEGGQVVAALGHPSSDDGALGAADVAIAMGAAGRPAGEWGVALASDDVRDAALALALAHSVRDRSVAVMAAGLAPGVVALLALGFGVGGLVWGPIAMGAGAAAAMTLARKE